MRKTRNGFYVYILLFTFLVLKAHAQSEDNIETRKLGGYYHAVKVSSGITLNIVKGDSEKVSVISSNADYRDKIKTIVKDDTLKVFFFYKNDPNWKGLVNSKEKFIVTIHQTNLSFINVSEGAHVNCQSQITSELLDLKLTSGSELTGDINCQSLLVNIKDGSELKITGVATTADYKITGGSYTDSKNVLTNTCKAEVYSASKLYLHVIGKLDVLGKNKSEIYFKDSPTIVKKELENSLLKHNFL